MINVQNISSKLAIMPDAALKQFAEMHKDDPYTFSLALSESNRRKQLRSQPQQMAPQPKVIDKELEDMNIRKALPEDLGIAKLPINMDMPAGANGGIVAFNDGGMSHYDKGGTIRNAGEGFTNEEDSDAFRFAFNNTMQLEGGLNKDDKVGGLTKYGISQRAYPNLDIAKLTPADARAIYKRDYWDKIGGDELAKQDPKLAALAFDTAVQHGVSGAQKMLDKSDNDPAKLLQIRTDKLQSLVEKQPEKYGKQAKGWANRLSKLAFNLIPSSTAIAGEVSTRPAPSTNAALSPNYDAMGNVIQAEPSEVAAAEPQPTGIAALAPEQVAPSAPAPSDEGTGAAAGAATAAAGLGYYPAKAGYQALQEQIKAADAARVLQGSKVEQALADQAARNTSQLRLPGPSGGGVTPATDKLLAEQAAKRVAAKQAAITSSEMAGKYGLGSALRGGLSAGRLALNPAVMGLGAIGEQLGGFQRGVMAAPTGQKLKEALYENPMLGAMDPDAAFGAAIMDAPKIAEQQNTQFNPKARADDRTKRNPENYRPAPVSPAAAVDDRTKRNPENYKPEVPQQLAPEEKKQIISVAKDNPPPNEDTDGWSKNDWLQFGLALMAGKSSNALTNVGEAGLSLLASKQARDLKNREMELYRQVHMEKPGEREKGVQRVLDENPNMTYTQALARYSELTQGPSERDRAIKQIMASNPKLSYAQALEQYTYLTGGATREDVAASKAEAAKTARFKAYQEAVKALDSTIVGLQGKAANATPAQKQAYQNALIALEKKAMLSDEQKTTPTAPAVPPVKVVGVERTR